MHAEANGFDFLTAEHDRHSSHWWQPRGLESFRSTWRMDDVRDIPYTLSAAIQRGGLTDDDRDAFRAFYFDQLPRWEAEARAAHDLLALMPDATDLRGYDNGGEPCERLPLPSWLIGADPEYVDI